MQSLKIVQRAEYLVTTVLPMFDLVSLPSSAEEFNHFVIFITVPFIRTRAAFFAMRPPVNNPPATPSV